MDIIEELTSINKIISFKIPDNTTFTPEEVKDYIDYFKEGVNFAIKDYLANE